MISISSILEPILLPFDHLGDAIDVLGLPHRELISFSFYEALTTPAILTRCPHPSPVREVRAENPCSSLQVLPTPRGATQFPKQNLQFCALVPNGLAVGLLGEITWTVRPERTANKHD
jgi:hypothetical protein